MCSKNCKLFRGLEKKFTLVFLFAQVVSIGSSSPVPEDWVSGSPFSHFTVDDTRADTFTSAYLNVTFLTEDGWKWDKTDVGRYGGGYIGPAFGELIHVTSLIKQDDHTGCQLPFGSSRADQKLPPFGTPWIALIMRGRCNFEVKVENAFRSNAAGVLVYNDRDSASLDKMKLSSDSRRNISAVFIYKWKGDELANKLENDSKVFIHITIAGHTSSRTANINRTSVLFVSVTFIVLMIISLTWLVFYYVQRFRYIRTKDKITKRLGNAAKKALSKIPTKNLKSEDKEIQGDCECCAVCIEPYKLSETLRILPCGHEYHKSCIDPWLLEHRTCPMCKMDILKHYGFVLWLSRTLLTLVEFTGSQESILQLDGDMSIQESLESQNNSPRHLGGLSPLPEIRAIVSDRQMPRFFVNSVDDDSSRASTPDEMTPSLPHRGSFPVRQELCVSCIAAKAASIINQINIDKQIVIDEEASTSTKSDIQQVLSMNSDSDKRNHNSTTKRCT